jgi:hypothetical protein
MTADANTELYLWNKNVDSAIRVLQRIQVLGICSKETLKAMEIRLNDLRAALNVHILETMLARERVDEARFQPEL